MNFEAIRCPYCGSAGNMEKREEFWYCVHCGNYCSDDSLERAYEKLKEDLHRDVKGAIDEALLERREEEYYNLRSALWEKVNAKYINSAAIISICRDIKKLDPKDFLACFFEVANSGTPEEVSSFIDGISVRENEMFVDLVIEFMIKSLTSEYVMPVGFLIERAYKGRDLQKFEKYVTRLETEAQKVDSGIYSTMIPRDVFIAYSSKDMDKVIELMNILEKNGLSCFVALRNLQHGRDAVANYRNALRQAIDNSKMIVFISSKNSRTVSCDAIKEELGYIRDTDTRFAPAVYKNDYANMPYKYKKPRIEYRLDNKPSPVDRFVNEFFSNLDYCETPEKVLSRIVDYTLYGADGADEPENEVTVTPAAKASVEEQIKYCTECGAKNPVGVKFCGECGASSFAEENQKFCATCGATNSIKMRFCGECGGKNFVFTDAEAKNIIAENKAKAEAELKAKEEAERKAKEEAQRKAKEEAERKAKEEAERKAKEEAERKAKEEAERKAKEEAERKAKEEAERKAKEEAERKAKEEAELKAKEEAERKEREEDERIFLDSCKLSGTKLVKYTGNITDVIIPDSITEIDCDAFGECDSLVSVVIPRSVTVIGAKAFYNCSNLASIVIPNSVTEIGYLAFWNCKSLTSIVFPDSVIKIGAGAFTGCTKLTSITVNENNRKYKSIDGNLYSKDGKTLIQYAIGKADTSFVIPDGVTSIDSDAFLVCQSLTSIVIPDSVISIGFAAFSGCVSLKNVIIPIGVTDVGYNAFYGVPEVNCRAKKPLLGPPKGWDKKWCGKYTKVIWNYKG